MSRTKKPQLDRPALEQIAETFKLFSDATRLSILQALREGPRPVNDIVEELGTSQANISKHLKLLYDGGLLSRESGTRLWRCSSTRSATRTTLCTVPTGKSGRFSNASPTIR